MSKTLEEVLRAKAKSGDLNHISIAWLHNGGFEVAYRGTLHADHRRSEGADVVNVLMDALTGCKSVPDTHTEAHQVDERRSPPKRAAKPKPVAAAAPDYDDMLDDL